MEAEKVYQEKTARTLQQKQDGGGALQFVDNRSLNAALQRVGEDEEDDTLQGKFDGAIQREEDEDEAIQGKFEAPVQRKNETGMPDNLKAGVESLSGFAMDDVRVHYNSDKPATVQALAYTQGTDIHVAPGQEQHLPHEAWHVAQQMAGRVEPTTEVGGMPVNDNAGLEHEADVMGAKAMQMKKNIISGKLVNKIIQRITEEDVNQASFIVTQSAKRHGFDYSSLTSIMRHRYNEIIEGQNCSMLIGQGTEEGYGVYGQILYNCYKDQEGIYHITIFHAHSQGRMG